MTPEQINIAIAMACGWTNVHVDTETIDRPVLCGSHPKYSTTRSIPNYLTDLNAMHEAIDTLPSDGSWHRFIVNLKSVCHWDDFNEWVSLHVLINASSEQRAEAFLKTIGKWVEE